MKHPQYTKTCLLRDARLAADGRRATERLSSVSSLDLIEAAQRDIEARQREITNLRDKRTPR